MFFYSEIFFFFVTGFLIFLIACILISVAFLIGLTQFSDFEKLSTYECGFETFHDNRSYFEVRYYVVAILFIIFDLEIIFLFPWALGRFYIVDIGFYSLYFFLFVLTLGFVFEWLTGGLDWD
jgi:NADH:ubiquinone oxidoreductase subunit 3 (subunit A)